MSAAALVAAAWSAGSKPEPLLTVSSWADAHRVLPSQSAEPGRWRTNRTPYLQEIMDCLSVSSPIEKVVFQASAQVGKTETGLNWLGYLINHAPGTILLAWPSDDTIKRNVGERIDPLIENCPVLAGRVVEKKSRDAGNTTNKKAFPGGALHIVSAQSAISLRSLPVRFLFLDEIDAYPAQVGRDGDPVRLAERRTQTYKGRSKTFLCSTPSVKGFSRIEAAYLESDQRVYECPCPHCGDYSELLWKDIKWPPGAPQEASWWCPSCGCEVEERQKFAMVSRGRWRATATTDGKVAGFKINALVSPFASWGDLARDFVAVHKDVARLREFVNNALGECWDESAGEGLNADSLASRREVFPPSDTLPAGVAVICAGIDVQQDRIEASIIGFGAGEESFVIAHTVLWGDITANQVWVDLDELLKTKFKHAAFDIELPIRAAAIDTGYQSVIVTNWCRGKEGRRIWAIKGSSTANSPLWPRQSPKKQKGKAPVFLVGSTAGKDLVLSRLKNTGSGPGVVHFNATLPDQYFEQLTAEKVRTKYVRGFPVREYFKPDSARNEALDCFVYAAAALAGLKAARFDLDKEFNKIVTTCNPRVESSQAVVSLSVPAAKLPLHPVPTPGARASSSPARPRVIRSAYLG
jgi:phage terminase large subunit GpA-like protein